MEDTKKLKIVIVGDGAVTINKFKLKKNIGKMCKKQKKIRLVKLVSALFLLEKKSSGTHMNLRYLKTML